jgi:pimeloyl-ACP methyl ester carboxylesterase
MTAGAVRLPDGRRAELWQGGDPSGLPVLFFHGCPDSRLAARPGDAAARRAGVRLVAVSRPGYGGSDPADSDHLSVADDAVAVADALGIGRFGVLGMSVGGPYALACAARHPERVTGAVVAAAPADVPALDPPFPRDGLTPDEQAFFTRLAGSSVEECVELMRPDFEVYVARVSPHDPDDAALRDRWLAALPSRVAGVDSRLRGAAGAPQARESVGSTEGYLRDAVVSFRAWPFDPTDVACPVFLHYGELDTQVSVRNGLWLRDHLPDAGLVVHLRTGHLATLWQHWDEVLGELTGTADAAAGA